MRTYFVFDARWNPVFDEETRERATCLMAFDARNDREAIKEVKKHLWGECFLIAEQSPGNEEDLLKAPIIYHEKGR